MLQETKLSFNPAQLTFSFNHENSSYQSQLILKNLTASAIYFKTISTFGKLLTLLPPTTNLQPSQQLFIKIKLKIPNQIQKHSEKLFISYSQKQLSSYFYATNHDNLKEIKLKFDQNVPDEEDQVIKGILMADCQELCQEAEQLFKQGLIKKALYKYEESFLLYRPFSKGLYGMSECLYLLQEWKQALQAIQTALIFYSDPDYQWLKLKIEFQLYQEKPKDIYLIRYLKQKLQKLSQIQNSQQKKLQILKNLNEQEQKINEQKGGRLMYQFIEKALENYQKDQNLKNLYKVKSIFQKQLNQVLGIHNTHTIQQTPQYVLDPISYEIMKQPVIAPSGHSYQRHLLKQYLQNHQHKDLYTRQQLRFQWVRENIALKKFISENQHLKNWMQYEMEISTFK